MKRPISETIYFIKYVFNYKSNVKELDDLTQKYDKQRSDIYKLNEIVRELKEKNTFLNERVNSHLETIKGKNKEIRYLKKRDAKLNKIENALNKKVLLKDLKELIRGE